MTAPPEDFVLPVDKVEGPTSHDVVSEARRALGVRRVGHTGTLDPFASGLLLLCVGRATRLAEYLSGMDKTYDAVVRLGVRTDTLDPEGAVVSQSDDWRGLSVDQVEAVLSSFLGETTQVPPVYSAKKIGGQRAYRRARQGQEVALTPCPIRISLLKLTRFAPPDLAVTLTCSAGTYVRALARDLGEALGVGAHLTSLRRTAIGAWSVDRSLPSGELGDPAKVALHRVSLLDAVSHLARLEVDDDTARRLTLGQAVPLSAPASEPATDGAPSGGAPDDVHGSERRLGLLAVAHRGSLLAIGEAVDGVLRPRKVFAA